MKDATVTRFKLFWAHQDEEQEAWLRAMARQGLHLVNVNPFGFWTFRRGAPADVVYRLDFSNQENAEFMQLMQDAGWKLAATTCGWHYWCTPLAGGRVPEIFSDGASKARIFQRVIALLVCSALPAFIMMILTKKGDIAANLSRPSLIILGTVYLTYFVFLAYTILRLLLRIRAVRAPQGA